VRGGFECYFRNKFFNGLIFDTRRKDCMGEKVIIFGKPG